MYLVPDRYEDQASESGLVTLNQIRTHLNLADDTYEQDILTRFGASVQEVIERSLERPIVSRVRTFKFRDLVAGNTEIQLRHTPIQAVTQIAYYSKTNVATVVPAEDYLVEGLGDNTDLRKVEILPIDQWPTYSEVQHRIYPLQIQATVGFDVVPSPIVEAALQIIGLWYSNREAASVLNYSLVPYGAEKLLNQYSLTNPIKIL